MRKTLINTCTISTGFMMESPYSMIHRYCRNSHSKWFTPCKSLWVFTNVVGWKRCVLQGEHVVVYPWIRRWIQYWIVLCDIVSDPRNPPHSLSWLGSQMQATSDIDGWMMSECYSINVQSVSSILLLLPLSLSPSSSLFPFLFLPLCVPFHQYTGSSIHFNGHFIGEWLLSLAVRSQQRFIDWLVGWNPVLFEGESAWKD